MCVSCLNDATSHAHKSDTLPRFVRSDWLTRYSFSVLKARTLIAFHNDVAVKYFWRAEVPLPSRFKCQTAAAILR